MIEEGEEEAEPRRHLADLLCMVGLGSLLAGLFHIVLWLFLAGLSEVAWEPEPIKQVTVSSDFISLSKMPAQ